MCELFVNYLGFGFVGVAYASNCSETLLLLIVVLIIHLQSDEEVIAAWIKWDWRDIFFELRDFIKIASAGLFIHCLESWANEAL
jgi:Na+-driven multidrug efflux pump